MLREKYPGVRFEVVNTAIVATNSHVVRRIAFDCARHEPDLIVVYLGNNEVVGPFGAGTVFAPLSDRLALIRLGISFKATRVGQLLSNTVGRLRKPPGPDVWTGMEMFLGNQVRFDDPSLHTVYRHFRSNLEDIRDAGVGSGAKVIISSVGSNLADSPPFASLHRADLSEAELERWQECYDRGIGHEEKQEPEAAVAAYLEAAEIDETFADLQYRIATCCRQLGEFDRARDHYVKAREHDSLRFRADHQINAIIESVATGGSGDDVRFVDAVAALQAASPQGIPGATHFHEHVHMKFAGNYLVARAILGQAEELLPDHVRSRKAPGAEIPHRAAMPQPARLHPVR